MSPYFAVVWGMSFYKHNYDTLNRLPSSHDTPFQIIPFINCESCCSFYTRKGLKIFNSKQGTSSQMDQTLWCLQSHNPREISFVLYKRIYYEPSNHCLRPSLTCIAPGTSPCSTVCPSSTTM